MTNGLKQDGSPGAILHLWGELRKQTGVLHKTKKPGMKFETRSAETLIDLIREKANNLGILIYPTMAHGKGFVVEDGTLADVSLTVIAQAIEDGSCIQFAGFGLGADSQDKAGGKAGTYAFKQALIQALLAGGSASAKSLGVADTDDTDTPIAGGVKPKSKAPSVESIRKTLAAVNSSEDYSKAVKLLMLMSPPNQLAVKTEVVSAKARSLTSAVG